ncbi:MAG: hypothetical protein K8R02_00090 [Anaerohalosphaeraceae bacterium]|nr:hypothetical protein [Anaerohalosphaeraceae bacterium]
MKNVIMILMLVVVVGVLSVSANAAALVYTNFEEASAGLGTWTLPGPDPCLPWQKSVGGQPDPVSGVNWHDINGAMFADVTEAVAGEQVAFLGSGDCARLRFAGDTGNDSNSFTTTLMMFQHPVTNTGGYTHIEGRNGPDQPNSYYDWRISWEIRMHNDANDTVQLQAWSGPSLETLATGLSEDVWYDVKVEADYDASTYDVSYRVWTSDGSNAWILVADDISFVAYGYGHDGWGGGNALQTLDMACKNSYAMMDNASITDSNPPVCGDWSYLDGDRNEDCYVDFKDIDILAESWLDCTNPADSNCVAMP